MRSARRLLTRENGSLVVALPLVFLLFAVLVWVTRTSQNVVAADVVLKESVAIAVKAAANQYDRDTGRIDFRKGQRAFEEMLCKNLRLKGNLEARKDSPFCGQPSYVLILYNGQGARGEPAGIRYEWDGREMAQTPLSGEGFPRTFHLEEGLAVTLASPGAVGAVELAGRGIYGAGPVYRRWAAARVSSADDGGRVVVLVGRASD